MSESARKKKLNYPEETPGSRMAAYSRVAANQARTHQSATRLYAAAIRKRANKLTKEERREHFQAALRVYYGAEWPKEAAGR